MTTPVRSLALLTGPVVLGLLLGCNPVKEPTTAPPPPGFDTESGPFAAGKKVYVAHGCFRCHGIGGIGGPDAMAPIKGPNLGHVGARDEHTVDWLMEHIRNPKSHTPDSGMPSYEGKISDADLRALAEYLASLK